MQNLTSFASQPNVGLSKVKWFDLRPASRQEWVYSYLAAFSLMQGRVSMHYLSSASIFHLQFIHRTLYLCPWRVIFFKRLDWLHYTKCTSKMFLGSEIFYSFQSIPDILTASSITGSEYSMQVPWLCHWISLWKIIHYEIPWDWIIVGKIKLEIKCLIFTKC